MADTDVITTLAELPPDALVFLPAVAAYLHRHPKSVRHAVARGELPPPIRLMRRSAWTAGAIVQHLQRRQAEAAQRRVESERHIAALQP
jgi:predicted DNA-binding transcriptional regulator AlpA